MGNINALVIIFVFGLGISFIVARGLWEARDYRSAQLREARAKKKAKISLIEDEQYQRRLKGP
jgi:hypothetical protein